MSRPIPIIEYVSILSPFPGILLFALQKGLKSHATRVLIVMLVVNFLIDIGSLVLARQGIGNLILANSYFLIQFILVAMIYRKIYLKNSSTLISGFVLIFVAVNTLYWQGANSIQSLNWVITSMMIIVMSAGHFLHLAKNPVIKVNEYGPFWISTGLLFYCTFSFAILAFANVLVEFLKVDDFRLVWMFHNLNNIFKNGCFFMAIWWAARRDPSLDMARIHEN